MNRQIFEDNFFHSDLHPGNILLLRNNEIALIDFGAVGSLESEFLQKYTMYYQAIVGRQFDRAVDLLLLLAPQSTANARTEEFRKRYLAVMKTFETKTATSGLRYHERSIVSVFGDIMKDLAALEIPLDWSFMRADRAQLTLDASLMYLCRTWITCSWSVNTGATPRYAGPSAPRKP
jgi:ubiquinone biosynthesis protein